MISQQSTDDYELVPHSKLKHMHSFMINITYRNYHLHSDFELILVLKGKGNIRVRDRMYILNEHDSMIINQNEIHEIESITEPFTMLMIQFSRHFCTDYFPTLRNTTFHSHLIRPYYTSEEYDRFVQRILQFNLSYINASALSGLTCTAYLSAILHSLYSHLGYTIIKENQYRENKKKSERLNRISTYIGSNYLNPLRLKDLADMEGITTTHMSHIFSENFGITFQEYLISKRVEEAVRLSHEGHQSASMISELSGFSDPKYLNKAFLNHFGCSYKEYLQNNIIPVLKKKDSSKNVFEHYLSYDECLEIHNNYA